MRTGLLTLALLLAAPPLQAQPSADRFMTGGSVSVTGRIAGDLVAAGGEVDVDAQIAGDTVVSGGDVRLGGTMQQDLYAAGGRLSVQGAVQRNARIAGGRIDLGPRSKIAGNVSIAGGHVRIDGSVGGNLDVAGGALELGPSARINGSLRYASRDELRRDPAAQVQGGIERFGPRAPLRAPERFGRALGWLWSIGLLILAAVLAAASPTLCTGVAATVRTRWPGSLLVGFIALVCIPVAALIAMVTLVGVPLALVAIALYLPLLLLGYVSAGLSAGQLALERFQPARASRTGWRMAAAMLGMLAIVLLARLPWVGALVVLTAMLLGMGALLMRAYSGRTSTGPGEAMRARSAS